MLLYHQLSYLTNTCQFLDTLQSANKDKFSGYNAEVSTSQHLLWNSSNAKYSSPFYSWQMQDYRKTGRANICNDMIFLAFGTTCDHSVFSTAPGNAVLKVTCLGLGTALDCSTVCGSGSHCFHFFFQLLSFSWIQFMMICEAKVYTRTNVDRCVLTMSCSSLWVYLSRYCARCAD